MAKKPGRPLKFGPVPSYLRDDDWKPSKRTPIKGGAVGDYGPLEGSPSSTLALANLGLDPSYVAYQREQGKQKGREVAQLANKQRKQDAAKRAEERQRHIVQTHRLRLISAQSVNQIAKAIQNDEQLGGVGVRLLSEDVKAARRSLQGR